MRAAALLLAFALVFGAVVVAVAPTASACIQVYPYSQLCGNPVGGAKKVLCSETDGRACLP